MRTEQILPPQVQGLVDAILSQNLILAEVELEDIIIDGVLHKQFLRVKDVNIALSLEYLKVNPRRIFINTESNAEIDLNQPVPNWERHGSDMMALVDENGERMLFQTNYYDDVIINEETGETEEQLIETKQEVKLVPTLKTLMLIIGTKAFKVVFEDFTNQYVNDTKEVEPDYFKTLK